MGCVSRHLPMNKVFGIIWWLRFCAGFPLPSHKGYEGEPSRTTGIYINTLVGLGRLPAKPLTIHIKAQAAWLRYCNGTPPASFENCFACFRMPSPSLGTQPADVPYAITDGEKIVLVLPWLGFPTYSRVGGRDPRKSQLIAFLCRLPLAIAHEYEGEPSRTKW